jgi:hypothetical protein
MLTYLMNSLQAYSVLLLAMQAVAKGSEAALNHDSAFTSSNISDSVLVPFKFNTLPLGSIKASGWLEDQLQLSASGLGGHLFEFYRYVERSTWLG